jgi:ubiquinone/menaquinone biosynthesis C-methylase UbiE
MIAEIRGDKIYAVEPSHLVRAVAASNTHTPAVRSIAGRAEAIPIAAAGCDAVVMFFVLHHITDLQTAANELARPPCQRTRARSGSFPSG